MMIRQLAQSLLLLSSVSLVSACGFTLRGSGGSFDMPDELQTLRVNADDAGNDIVREVQSALRASGVTLVDSASQSRYEITVGDERSQERIISLDSSARAGEYAITMTVTFQLRDGSRTVLGPDEVSLEQTYQADQDNAIAKDEEARTIRAEMRREIANQILARLQSFEPEALEED